MRHLKLIAAVAFLLTIGTAVHAQTAAGAALARKIPSVKFEQIALKDALDFFRDTTGANFTIDWKSIEEAGLGKDTPVSLQLKNVAMSLAMKKTLDAAGPGLMTFYVNENVITVTSVAKADTEMVTMVYPVGDLLVETPDFQGPEFSLDQNQGGSRSRGNRNSGGGGGSSGSTGNSIFGGAGGSNGTSNDEKSKTRTERATELIEIIHSTIRPEIWDVNGGKSSIKYLNGNLIITAPRTVQGGY